MGLLTLLTHFDVTLPDRSDWEDAEFRLALWAAAYSHGHLDFGTTREHTYPEIGVAEAGADDPGTVWMRFDWSVREDRIPLAGPGLRSMLMMADALRLLGATSATRVRMETLGFTGDPWPDGTDDGQERRLLLSEQADRWVSPHMTFPWQARTPVTGLAEPDAVAFFRGLFPLAEIWPREWTGGFPTVDRSGTLTMRLADDLPAFGWFYDALGALAGEPPPTITGTRLP